MSEHTAESIATEAGEIMANFRALKVGNLFRKINIACFMKCGGDKHYPFQPNPNELQAEHQICFGDCMNINLEKGPYLKDLGEVPEGKIAKKFIWGSAVRATGGGDDDDEDEDDE